VTRRLRRFPSLLFVLGLVAAGMPEHTRAAEIAGTSGIVTLAYDETLWSGQRDQEGEPELACIAEACGGDTAGCGSVLVRRDGSGLSEEVFLGGFREHLDEETLKSAKTNAGEASRPEIVSPSSVATIGGRTAVTLSMRLAFDGTPTRVDHFWLQAGSAIAGLACVVAEAEYGRARPAFERVFTDMAVRAP
jgi:hypothetical protein